MINLGFKFFCRFLKSNFFEIFLDLVWLFLMKMAKKLSDSTFAWVFFSNYLWKSRISGQIREKSLICVPFLDLSLYWRPIQPTHTVKDPSLFRTWLLTNCWKWLEMSNSFITSPGTPHMGLSLFFIDYIGVREKYFCLRKKKHKNHWKIINQ